MTGGDPVTPALQPATLSSQGYADLAAANSWFQLRGRDEWQLATDADRQAALVRAADWLDGQFRFRGAPRDESQSRSWPRRGIGTAGPVDARGIPLPVMQAYFDLVLACLEGDDAAETLVGLRGAVRRERIGGLAVEYADVGTGRSGGGRAGAGRAGGRLMALLAPYLDHGTTTRVSRS